MRASSIFLYFCFALRTHVDFNLVQVIINQLRVALLFRVRFGTTLYTRLSQACFAFYSLTLLFYYFATVRITAEHQRLVLQYSQIVLKTKIFKVNIFTHKLLQFIFFRFYFTVNLRALYMIVLTLVCNHRCKVVINANSTKFMLTTFVERCFVLTVTVTNTTQSRH